MAKVNVIKVICLFLVLVFVFTMSACAKKATEEGATSAEIKTSPEALETTKAETTKAKDYAWEKYPTPITVTVGQRTSTGVQHLEGDTWENNIFTREIESRFNIKVKVLWTADTTQYSTKLNVALASGELPDIFSPDSAQFFKIAKSGILADLTEVFEKYASDDVKASMQADEIGFNSGKIDGKLLGLSWQHWGLIGQIDVLWIRNDWMKKLNLQAPKMIEDLIKICETFVKKDPDGNGKNDTVGLGVMKDFNSMGSLIGFFNAFGAYPGLWIKDSSGKIVYGWVQPEVKSALKVLQDMYKRGLIDKEFALKDMSKVAEDIVAGKIGIWYGGNWNGYYPGPDFIRKNGADAIFMPYALPQADNKPVVAGMDWPITIYSVVNKNCKYPEAAIKIANLDTEIYQRSDYETYKKFIGGNRNWCTPVCIAEPRMSDWEVEQISYALKTGDESKLGGDPRGKYEGCIDWIKNKNPDSVGYWLQVGPEGAFAVVKKNYMEPGNYLRTEYKGVDTPSMIQYKGVLDTMIKETITKIIMGAPLDDFDKMVEEWKKSGGDAMTKEINDLKF